MRRKSLTTLITAGALALSLATVGIVTTTGTSSAATHPGARFKPYDISIGDSYSVGYQNPSILNSTGFTGYVAKKEKMHLANFGCSGATTTSIFDQTGCPVDASAPATSGGVAYPTTNQVAAALAFIAAHPAQVGLVTVSIGGNDVTHCATLPSADTVACVLAADSSIASNVGNLVTQLDTYLTSYADTPAHIVGITYPDVILGDWVAPVGSTDPSLAELSITAFDDLINPTLNTAYTSVARGVFVDVTSARYKRATAGDDTGTFASTAGAAPYTYTGPTQNLKGFSKTAPVAVAEVCDLTWYCNATTFGDIHANTKGYDFIGGLVVAKLISL
jgi:lysophospholipase L1-like esterase